MKLFPGSYLLPIFFEMFFKTRIWINCCIFYFLSQITAELTGAAYSRPLEYLVGLLLRVGWPEALKHRVVFGAEGFQLRILGFSSSSQDGVCKTNAV